MSNQVRRPGQPAEPREDLDEAMVARYAEAHRKSLEENQPATFRAMSAKGTLQAHCQSVGETAARTYLDLMEPTEQAAKQAQGYEAKLGLMEAGTLQAEAQVMREVVLVPDSETAKAEREGAYR